MSTVNPAAVHSSVAAAPAPITPDVLIIGAGPAGLTAAAELAARLPGQVLVLDRESRAGGIPRHSDHPGYGIRDLHRFLSGPRYAERLTQAAEAAGAIIRTCAMVTGWTRDGAAEVTTPEGRLHVRPKVTVLATGARERPRSARLIPGDRPRGVYTTGQLQNLVHLHQGVPGTRAVVVGAELVSWSAVMTLREAGCGTVLMTTTHPSPESYAAFNVVGRMALQGPIATRTRVVSITGQRQVSSVVVENIDTGHRRDVDCDTVVFTGEWIPDYELAQLGGIVLDADTKGPQVDAALRTSRPGLFAVGNLVHPVDTADVAALDGRHVAAHVLAFLDGTRPDGEYVRILAEPPFRWVAPSLYRPDDPVPARGRFLLWIEQLVRAPHISIRQAGREIAHRRITWPASPGRVFRLPATLLAGVQPGRGDVTVALRRH